MGEEVRPGCWIAGRLSGQVMAGRRSYFGIVGNGETVALIGPDARIAWLCAPRVDAFPVFASALDPARGGSLSVDLGEPVVPVYQRYAGRTNVLETKCRAGELSVLFRDFMPWGKRFLVRVIEIVNEGSSPREVNVSLRVVPIRARLFRLRIKLDGQHLAIEGPGVSVRAGFQAGSTGGRSVNLGRLSPGEKKVLKLALAYGETREESLRLLSSGEGDVDEEIKFWQQWLKRAFPLRVGDREAEEAYYRSLLVLKLLTYRDTGAIVAAPTISFPAVPRGQDNWDYRYCWLRDGYLTALAFDQAGLHEEAASFYEFAFNVQEDDGRWRYPLYTVDGWKPGEIVIPDLEGVSGEKPIRLGNRASAQLQLDNEGSVIHGFRTHYELTGDRDLLAQYWDNIRRAAQHIKYNWHRRENGIWEFRHRRDHWVYGKVMCYAGLTNAAYLAQEMGYKEYAYDWGNVARTVKNQVLARGWSEQRRAFVQRYGANAPLDISVLALEFYGLVDVNDSRLISTVNQIDRPATEDGHGGLNMWGAVARYEGAALPFYLPTLWLARHYLQAGMFDRAEEFFSTCLRGATDLYLMAEHFDPRTGEQWGNFPQGFSHEEVVRYLLLRAELADRRSGNRIALAT